MSRRVVVTGGAAGIGLAIARAFAAEGDRVAVCDTDAGALAALPSFIAGTLADVTDAAAMTRWLDGIEAAWGGVDVLCANAGIG
ncbi:MAG: SDR family NAD(P)-dependent oxidoreductase, partial [Pseudomonadota bacterium]